jgi:acyl-CoA synthetase (AMP-forming)/AMP-acid ligase II
LLPGPGLMNILRGQGVNVATLPPTALAEMSEADLPALRTVVSAGEACTMDLIRRWAPGRRFVNGYGPTEATVATSVAVCNPADTKVTIGRPIANYQIYILDSHRAAVPVGVPGELCIGGVGLARGYHNRPELTAERFIANPFSAEPKARLYKTGDLARYLPDGNIEYLGRLDHQVKIRGFRIELGEIEAELSQCPGVQACVVVAREDAPGMKRLVAYLVARKGEVQAADLRAALRARLPDYMVPAAFVTLDTLPLSPNGKVDRKALPKPDEETTDEQFEPPATPTEIALANIWSEVLGVKRIGLQHNFFDLGGHSLLAVRVASRVSAALQTEMPLRTLINNPTLAGCAGQIDNLLWARGQTAGGGVAAGVEGSL